MESKWKHLSPKSKSPTKKSQESHTVSTEIWEKHIYIKQFYDKYLIHSMTLVKTLKYITNENSWATKEHPLRNTIFLWATDIWSEIAFIFFLSFNLSGFMDITAWFLSSKKSVLIPGTNGNPLTLLFIKHFWFSPLGQTKWLLHWCCQLTATQNRFHVPTEQ